MARRRSEIMAAYMRYRSGVLNLQPTPARRLYGCVDCRNSDPAISRRVGLRSGYCCWSTWLQSRLRGDDISWAPWGFRWGSLPDGGSGLVRSSSLLQSAGTLRRVRRFNKLYRRFSGRWVRDGVRGRRVPLAWMLSGLRTQGPEEEFVMISEQDAEPEAGPQE